MVAWLNSKYKVFQGRGYEWRVVANQIEAIWGSANQGEDLNGAT